MLRFGTSLYDDLKVALKELKQTNTVAEYQTQFEEISTKVTGLSEQWLISFFIVRLQDKLKSELLLAQPTTYYHVVSLAKFHEQNLLNLQSTLKQLPGKSITSYAPRISSVGSAYFLTNAKSTTQSNWPPKHQNVTKPVATTTSNSSNASSRNSHPYKKLTVAKLKARREKGLCYYCVEKYHPNHNAKPLVFC